MTRRLSVTAMLGLALSAGYFFGVLTYSRDLWPTELVRQIKGLSTASAALQPNKLGHFDSHERLTFYPGKQQVECPVQEKDTGVILIMGQSNAANEAQTKFTTRYANDVVNYFDGRCYVASSPLLGATGEGGEYITPLADQLISQRTYRKVVIIADAVGGSPIGRWQRDGDLNEALIALITNVRAKYQITDVIWHQGETDAAHPYFTTTKLYVSAFHSLLGTLTKLKVTAPIYVSIATRSCHSGANWTETNPVAMAQRMLIDNRSVFLGINADKLIESKDRYGCHFAETGQIKAAKAFANSISAAQKQLISKHLISKRSF